MPNINLQKAKAGKVSKSRIQNKQYIVIVIILLLVHYIILLLVHYIILLLVYYIIILVKSLIVTLLLRFLR